MLEKDWVGVVVENILGVFTPMEKLQEM